jgi:hypothetical protein
MFFDLRAYCRKRNEILARYYLRTNFHLIPNGVEFGEYDDAGGNATRIL